MANSGSRFTVLGQHTHNGKIGIFLLHLPDDGSWKVWQRADFSIEGELYKKAVSQWLDYCAFPLGMSNRGEFWLLDTG